MSAAPPANPVHAHVAYIRIPRFQTQPVAEQAALKERLENRVLQALVSVPAGDRVVLDADDGLVLVLYGDGERALRIGQQIHGGADGFDLQVGLNYGPLALTSRGADARVFGDGLSAAAAAARFATPEKLLVTETFARALQASAPEAARELSTAGQFTDTRVRQHDFYTPDPQLRALRRRRLLIYGAGGAVLILLIGVLGRDIYQPLFASRPAVVKLEIKPRAELFVDGISMGVSPPMGQVEMAPGKRMVQLRNPGYRTVDLELDLKPGQRTTLARTLVRQPDPKPKPKPDFWRDLKKKFTG